MRTGLYTLTVLLVLSMLATAIADLGFMHAGNEAWPPHAKFHAVWNVVHVALTHAVALGVIWYRPGEATVRLAAPCDT